MVGSRVDAVANGSIDIVPHGQVLDREMRKEVIVPGVLDHYYQTRSN